MNTPIIKKGWLRKQGGIVKTWQRRWTVLNADILFYFNRDDDAKPSGSLVLPGNRVFAHSYSPANPDKYIFEIEPEKNGKAITPNHEISLFYCESDTERQEWIRAIRKVMYGPNGGAIFGQSLKDTMIFEHKNNRKVPYFIEACVKFLEENGLETEGLYRLPGRVVLIKELQESFDTGIRLNLDDTEADVHTVASLLKLYFRELPDSIIPCKHFQQFMNIANDVIYSKIRSDEFVPRIKEAVDILELENYNVLQYLCRHLYKVSENSQINKMTLPNLAMVFGPNIIRHFDDNPEFLRVTAELNQKLALIIIEHSDVIFAQNRNLESLLDSPLESSYPVTLLQPIKSSSCAPLDTEDISIDFPDDETDEQIQRRTRAESLPTSNCSLLPQVDPLCEQLENINNKGITCPVPPIRRVKFKNSRKPMLSMSKSESDTLNERPHEYPMLSKIDPTRRYGWLSLSNSLGKNGNYAGDRKTIHLPLSPSDEHEKQFPDVFSSSYEAPSTSRNVNRLREEEISKSRRQVNSLKGDLKNLRALYQERVKEVQTLKGELEEERSAKVFAVQKIVNLQESLTEYQVKYGKLK